MTPTEITVLLAHIVLAIFCCWCAFDCGMRLFGVVKGQLKWLKRNRKYVCFYTVCKADVKTMHGEVVFSARGKYSPDVHDSELKEYIRDLIRGDGTAMPENATVVIRAVVKCEE